MVGGINEMYVESSVSFPITLSLLLMFVMYPLIPAWALDPSLASSAEFSGA